MRALNQQVDSGLEESKHMYVALVNFTENKPLVKDTLAKLMDKCLQVD